MKTKIYLFSVIFSLSLVSCDKEQDRDSALYFKTSLFEEQAEETLKSSDSGEDSLFTGATTEPSQEIVVPYCTGKDLEWYNGRSGELKFKDHITKNMRIKRFYAFFEDRFLFGLRLIPGVMSYVVHEPVLTQDYDDRYYISSGYPAWDLEALDKNDPTRISREKNWKALVESEGWKLFIEQLKKEGRYRE